MAQKYPVLQFSCNMLCNLLVVTYKERRLHSRRYQKKVELVRLSKGVPYLVQRDCL